MTYKPPYLILILLTLTVVLSNCGSSVPRNELQNLPALIDIISLNLTDGNLKARVSHRNNLTRKNNQFNCQIALKDFNTIKFKDIKLPDLTNYAVETVDIKLPSTELPAIKSSTDELSYVLDCYLFSDNFREEHIIKKATLYKVPGSLAEFR